MPRQALPPDPYASAVDLAEDIRLRRLSPVETVNAALARIARLNPALNAYLAVFEETKRFSYW